MNENEVTHISDLPKEMDNTLMIWGFGFVLIINASYGVSAPFLPWIAETHGVDQNYIGFMFGVYSISMAIASPIVGKKQFIYGRRNMAKWGLAVVAMPFLGFYLINYIENTIFFGVMFVVMRMIQGIGVSMAQTSIYSILTLSYSEKINYVIGMIEMSAGIGISFGPATGALLFDVGGLSLPFLFFFLLCLSLSFILPSVIPPSVDPGLTHSALAHSAFAQADIADVGLSEISYLKMLKNKRILFANLTIVLMMLQFTFLDPIFAHYLYKDFGVEYQHSGFFFLVLGLGYTFSCLFVHHATNWGRKRDVGMAAAILVGLFTIFYGPSHIIPTGHNLVLVIFGLFFAGVFDAFMGVPTMDEMIEAGSYELGLANSQEALSDITSGLFNLSYSAGEIIGPLLGNLIYTNLDFGMTTDIYGILIISFGGLYFVMMLNVRD